MDSTNNIISHFIDVVKSIDTDGMTTQEQMMFLEQINNTHKLLIECMKLNPTEREQIMTAIVKTFNAVFR